MISVFKWKEISGFGAHLVPELATAIVSVSVLDILRLVLRVVHRFLARMSPIPAFGASLVLVFAENRSGSGFRWLVGRLSCVRLRCSVGTTRNRSWTRLPNHSWGESAGRRRKKGDPVRRSDSQEATKGQKPTEAELWSTFRSVQNGGNGMLKVSGGLSGGGGAVRKRCDCRRSVEARVCVARNEQKKTGRATASE